MSTKQVSKLLSEVEAHQAEQIGKALGAFSVAELTRVEMLQLAAKAIAGMMQEGYVGKVSAHAGAYIQAIIYDAWHTAHPKTEMKISDDPVLANAQGKLNNIARAFSLDGYLMNEDGEKIAVRAVLLDKLQRNGSSTGGFNPCATKASEYVKLANLRAVNDLEFAKLIGFDPEKQPKGRKAKAPSPEALAAFVAKVPLMASPEIKLLLEAALAQCLNLVPAKSNDPAVSARIHEARTWIAQHGRQFIENTITRIRECSAAMVPTTGHKEQGALAESSRPVDGTVATGKAEENDQVTRARVAKQSSKGKKPKGEGVSEEFLRDAVGL